MADSVFLIEVGAYSDRYTIGIASSQAQAEAALAAHGYTRCACEAEDCDQWLPTWQKWTKPDDHSCMDGADWTEYEIDEPALFVVRKQGPDA